MKSEAVSIYGKNFDMVTENSLVLWGTVCGDVIGSCYERRPVKKTDFELFSEFSCFTDDTVCTVGIADALMRGISFEKSLRYWCNKYPRAGYGGAFRKWLMSESTKPYGSWGNGSAMRVSAVGVYAKSEEEVLDLAKQSAEITHNSEEGIKGAQATALAIYYALNDKTKEEIKTEIESRFGYNLSRSYADIQSDYAFDVSCQGSVPESVIAFLEGDDYEDVVRKAVALGGDADTMAAIVGGMAAAFYKYIPIAIQKECRCRLPGEIVDVLQEFGCSANRVHFGI